MSLRWRIALAMALLGAVVAAVAATGAYLVTDAELHAALDRSLTERVREVGAGPRPGQTPPPGSIDVAGCPPDALLRPADAAQVVLPRGTVAVCLPGAPELPAPLSPPTGDDVTLDTVDVDGVDFRVAAASFHAGGTLQIARSEAELTVVLTPLVQRLVVLTLAVSAGAGIVGWFVARRLVRPVARLRDAAHHIAATQDLATAVPVDGSGEIRDLGASFTTMVDALATSRAQQQRLVADAGHELRTPLTSLTTNLELLGRFDELPAEDRSEVVAALRTDVDELTHLTTELVELATDRSSDEPVADVDLAELAEVVVTRARRRSGRTIELVVDNPPAVPAGTSTERPDRRRPDQEARPGGSGNGPAPPATTVLRGRPQMLERAVANLVANAVAYAPDPSRIEVHASATSVEVRDHGPGIAPGDAERVFERFYRSDTARGTPGSGLGLAIVRQIVDRHGGRVWVRSGPDGGAWVGFELPPEPPG